MSKRPRGEQTADELKNELESKTKRRRLAEVAGQAFNLARSGATTVARSVQNYLRPPPAPLEELVVVPETKHNIELISQFSEQLKQKIFEYAKTYNFSQIRNNKDHYIALQSKAGDVTITINLKDLFNMMYSSIFSNSTLMENFFQSSVLRDFNPFHILQNFFRFSKADQFFLVLLAFGAAYFHGAVTSWWAFFETLYKITFTNLSPEVRSNYYGDLFHELSQTPHWGRFAGFASSALGFLYTYNRSVMEIRNGFESGFSQLVGSYVETGLNRARNQQLTEAQQVQAAKVLDILQTNQSLSQNAFVLSMDDVLKRNGFSDGDKIKLMMELVDSKTLPWSIVYTYLQTNKFRSETLKKYLNVTQISNTNPNTLEEEVMKKANWRKEVYSSNPIRTLASSIIDRSKPVVWTETDIKARDERKTKLPQVEVPGVRELLHVESRDTTFINNDDPEGKTRRRFIAEGPCISLMLGDDTNVQNQSMWTMVDDRTPRTLNQQKAEQVFTDLLSKSNFSEKTEILNSSQKVWLYRWMGPLCSLWTSHPDVQSPVAIIKSGPLLYGFFSEVCRKRFAFLKTMFRYSLLFPFLSVNEAKKYLTSEAGKSYFCVDSLQNRGIVVLHDCYPGYIRIIGITGNDIIQKHIDVETLVNIERVEDEKAEDFQKWGFSSHNIINAVLDVAKSMRLILLDNTCWKTTTKTAFDASVFLPANRVDMKVYPWDVKPFREINGFNNQRQESVANLAKSQYKDLVKNQDEFSRYKMPRYMELNPNFDITKASIKELIEKYDASLDLKDNSLSENSKVLNSAISTKTQIGNNLSRTRIDEVFKSYVSNNNIIPLRTESELYDSNKKILDQYRTDLQSESPDNALNALGVTPLFLQSLQGRCATRTIRVNIIHYMMINPLVATYVSRISEMDCIINVLIADAWFLQPLLQKLIENQDSVAIKRINAISSRENEGKLGTLDKLIMRMYGDHSMWAVKNQLQDLIYTGVWASLFVPIQ